MKSNRNLKSNEETKTVDKPKQIEVAYPLNAWRFVVEERFSLDGREFWALRIGIHENARKHPQVIAVCRTFEEAKPKRKNRIAGV